MLKKKPITSRVSCEQTIFGGVPCPFAEDDPFLFGAIPLKELDQQFIAESREIHKDFRMLLGGIQGSDARPNYRGIDKVVIGFKM
jgi:hypothetical protein